MKESEIINISIDALYIKACKVVGVPVNPREKNKGGSILKIITKLTGEIEKNKARFSDTNKRVNNILKVVKAYAKLDLTRKAYVGTTGDYFDALASGLNMLGEELESSTVSLHEKEVLLKEIHHRVKNNMQIISSLLNLQTEHITDKRSLSFFAENRRRIKSMALVHETLYQSKNISQVDFASYLKALVDSVREAYANSKPVRVILEAESHFLRIDTAIPCGLIVNELITNSFKYAFKGRKDREIQMEFVKEKKGAKKGHYRLNIRDNGRGLPAKFNANKSTTLGLQLVEMLTHQIDGSIVYKNNRGATFSISFPA